MPQTAIVRVEGAAQLRRGLRQLEDNLEDGKAVHMEIAKVVVNAAHPPVGPSGRTARSVRPAATKRAAIVRVGKASVPYTGVDHYGWPAKHIKENPWLIRAGQASESTWYPLYERYVERSLDKIRGATA